MQAKIIEIENVGGYKKIIFSCSDFVKISKNDGIAFKIFLMKYAFKNIQEKMKLISAIIDDQNLEEKVSTFLKKTIRIDLIDKKSFNILKIRFPT